MAQIITTSVTTKGQITLPKAVRKKWGIRPGRDQVGFRLSPTGRVEVVPVQVEERPWKFSKREWEKIAKLRRERGRVFRSAGEASKFLESL